MKRTRQKHRGIALMIVLTVVGLAALIGLAMLSSASLQAQIANSTTRSAGADYLAESALQAATYYLQYPAKLPASWGNNAYNYSVTGKSIPGVSGTFDVSVAATSTPDVYQIITTGRSSGGASSSPTKTADATIKIVRVTPKHAGGFGGLISIPTRHTFSSVMAGGLVTSGAPLYGTVSGAIKQSIDSTADFNVPTTATINYFGATTPTIGTYTLADGRTGTPELLGNNLTWSPVPSAGMNNPGSVFYTTGNTTISVSGTPNFTGTIIVRGGTLTVKKVSGTPTLTITPVSGSGLPAIISDGQLRMSGSTLNLVVNGVAWVNGTSWLSAPNTNAIMTINGSLLMPSGLTMGSAGVGTLTVNYTASNVNVLNLSTTAQPVQGVTLKTWK